MRGKVVRALLVLAVALGGWLGPSPAQAATSAPFQPSTTDSWFSGCPFSVCGGDAGTGEQAWNFGSDTVLRIKSGSGGNNRRTVVRFDLSTIPVDAAVKSANLQLWMSGIPGANRTYGAYRITNSWTETGVSWLSRDGVTNWTTAGGDIAGSATTTTAVSTGGVARWVTWTIKADVQNWVNGTNTNNGTLIKDQTENSTNIYSSAFSSKEDTTAGNRPTLTVSYLLKVRDLTATAGNGQVILNWVHPGTGSDYNGTLIIRQTGGAPTSTPTDGSNYTAGSSTLADGSLVVFNDTTSCATTCTTTYTNTGLTNGTTYYYQAFTRDGSNNYSLASATITSTPTSTLSGSSLWGYSTSAASLAPPGLNPNDVVVSGSNDNKLHGMSATNGTRAFNPFTTGGAIQARPPVIPAAYSATGLDVAYVTSQDGYVYAVDTNAGAQVWKSPLLGTTLQGGAAVWLQSIKALTIGGAITDAVFVGTRNTGSTTNNKVYALNGSNATVNGVAPGGILWTFNSGLTQSVDIISSTPYLDYTNNVVWVTSRSAGGTAQPSLWKLAAATGALLTSFNLGDIDSSPTPSFDGSFLYVGTNAGTLKAIRVSDGVVVATYTPASGTGAVNGLPWPLSSNAVGGGIAYVNSNVTAQSSTSTTCAVTLPAAPVGGNTNVVIVATVSTSVSSVSDTQSTYAWSATASNGTAARIEIWTATVASGASATVTVTLGAKVKSVCAVAQYSGVDALGITSTTTGSTANPSIPLTTQDNNNWVVAGFATAGTAVPTQVTGTLRRANATTGGSSVGGALTDNTSAIPASVTNTVAISSSAAWAAASLELRSTAPGMPAPDMIVFTQSTYVQSVSFNGSTFTKNWTVQLTGTPTVSAPVDDGANHLYIGASDGKVHQLDVETGTDQKQVTLPGATAPTPGDPAFDGTLNRIYVGASDGHIYSYATPF